MKHRFFALSVLALSLSLTSCLDETPKDQLPEQNIYDSANSLYVNAVASLYNYIGAHEESEGLQGTCRGIYDYNTLTTDEAIMPIRGGNWYDGGLWQNMYNIHGLPPTPICTTSGNISIRLSCSPQSRWRR